MKGVIAWGQSNCPIFHGFPSFLPLPGGMEAAFLGPVPARQTCLQGPAQGVSGHCDEGVPFCKRLREGTEFTLMLHFRAQPDPLGAWP